MLLDSQIATTSNLTLLRETVSRPAEQAWTYDRLQPHFKTTLYEELESRFGDIESLKKIFQFAWDASSELGRWCSDCVWSYALAEEVLPKLEGKVSKAFRTGLHNAVSAKESEVRRIGEACALVKDHRLSSPDAVNQLSSKVQVLRQELSRYFERPTDAKCIIFTKKRYTARLLGDLFSRLGIQHLRPGVLIGTRSGDDAGVNSTSRQQFTTLMKFRTGELNCLV